MTISFPVLLLPLSAEAMNELEVHSFVSVRVLDGDLLVESDPRIRRVTSATTRDLSTRETVHEILIELTNGQQTMLFDAAGDLLEITVSAQRAQGAQVAAQA